MKIKTTGIAKMASKISAYRRSFRKGRPEPRNTQLVSVVADLWRAMAVRMIETRNPKSTGRNFDSIACTVG